MGIETEERVIQCWQTLLKLAELHRLDVAGPRHLSFAFPANSGLTSLSPGAHKVCDLLFLPDDGTMLITV